MMTVPNQTEMPRALGPDGRRCSSWRRATPKPRLSGWSASSSSIRSIRSPCRTCGRTGTMHQYGVVIGEPQAGSEDLVYRDSILETGRQVGRRTYNRYQPHLGMVILSKGPDGIDRDQHPPGYRQVGNERYGQWRDEGRRAIVLGVLRTIRPAEPHDRWLLSPDLPERLERVPDRSRPWSDLLRCRWCVWDERVGHQTDQPQLLPPATDATGRAQPVVRSTRERSYVGGNTVRR